MVGRGRIDCKDAALVRQRQDLAEARRGSQHHVTLQPVFAATGIAKEISGIKFHLRQNNISKS